MSDLQKYKYNNLPKYRYTIELDIKHVIEVTPRDLNLRGAIFSECYWLNDTNPKLTDWKVLEQTIYCNHIRTHTDTTHHYDKSIDIVFVISTITCNKCSQVLEKKERKFEEKEF